MVGRARMRPGDKRLVAYVVPGDGRGDAEARAARASCSRRCPEYMVPPPSSRSTRCRSTPNGKVDRKALPAPRGGAPARPPYVAPRDRRGGAALAGIWAELLGVERGRRRTTTSSSSAATRCWPSQVARAARAQAFGVELPAARRSSSSPTRRRASRRAAIEALQAQRAGRALPPMRRVARDGATAAASFAQQRLWFLDAARARSAGLQHPVRAPAPGRARRRRAAARARRHRRAATRPCAPPSHAVTAAGRR